jgi:hypothetical protein
MHKNNTKTSAVPFGLFFGGLPFFLGPGGGRGALLSDPLPFSEPGKGETERPASDPSLHRCNNTIRIVQ